MDTSPSKNKNFSERAKGALGLLLILVAAFLGWTWYVNNRYTFVYDNNFKRSCIATGASESGCGCALDRLKANYSFSTAKAIERTGSYPNALLRDIQANCN